MARRLRCDIALEGSVLAGEDFAFGGIHLELDDLSLGHIVALRLFRRRRILGARGIFAIGQTDLPRGQIF